MKKRFFRNQVPKLKMDELNVEERNQKLLNDQIMAQEFKLQYSEFITYRHRTEMQILLHYFQLSFLSEQEMVNAYNRHIE